MSAKRTKISPRIRLQERDLSSKKPHSTNDGLAVGRIAPFSDNRALIFSQSNNILYPVMLPSGSSLADVVGITAKGRVTPGASDTHFNIPTTTVSPFDETGKLYPSSSYYLDPDRGMPQSFSGPLTSRIAIKIDITPSTEKFVYRCPQRHIDNAPLPLEFTTEGTGFCYFNFVSKTWDDVGNVDPLTGAAIKTDQAADLVPATYYLTESFAITSSVYYTGQFIPPNNIITRGNGLSKLSDIEARAMGIFKVGTPTATFLAPAASKYHAKSQNVLRMSDYISQPFLLERIQIDLPVVARRTHSSSSYFNPLISQYVANDTHCREMDNYVVSLYRQARNVQVQGLSLKGLERDNSTDITGSNRYLIASSSMCFYNAPSYKAGLYCGGIVDPPEIDDTYPYHKPAFSHNFDMEAEIGLTSPAFNQQYFSGSVSMMMVPEISSAGLGGVSYLPTTMSNTETAADVRARKGWSLNYIQHAWPGTSGIQALGSSDFIGSSDYSGKTTRNLALAIPATFKTFVLSASETWSNVTSSYTNLTSVDDFNWTSDILRSASFDFDPVYWYGARSCAETEPRFLKTPFGPAPFSVDYNKASFVMPNGTPKRRPHFIGGASTSGDERSRSSPIVLLPTDEIVLGIDAGIAPFMRDSSSITGSFLKIERKQASLTLFGSQIVNGERRGNQRSLQALGEAVHLDEVDTPVLDEFLLEKPITNIGSYYAPLPTGSFVTGTGRGIQAYFGYPTLLPLAFEGLVDWFKYPTQVTLTDDRNDPIDSGVFSKFIFRSDKFGQPANMLQASTNLASDVRRQVTLPGSALGGTKISSYPVTNVFTGSTVYSRNTSLHATSSSPFSD